MKILKSLRNSVEALCVAVKRRWTQSYLEVLSSRALERRNSVRMAATNLAKCIQRLYHNRENDEMADFVIESSDGKEIKVHPLILLSRGSDFLEKMLTRF